MIYSRAGACARGSSRNGNFIWFMLMLFAMGEMRGAFAADVITYVLGKNHHFDQFGATPVENALGEAWEAGVNVYATAPGSIVAATVGIPAAGVTLDLANQISRFELSEYFALKSDLDSTAPAADYVVTISTLHDGVKACALTLSTDAYPNAPLILSSNEAKGILVQQPFVLKWSAFTGGTASDYIFVVAASEYGASPTNYFISPLPNQAGALPGTATQVTIPANSLPPGYTGYFKVGFFKVVSRNTTDYPGVLGLAGYGSITKMPFQTIAPPTISQPLPSTVTTNAGVTVAFNAGIAGGGLTYQWRKDGQPIPSATTDTLTLANVVATNTASYTVVASNGAGSVTNGPVYLLVLTGVAGSVDGEFVTGTGGNGPVRALAVRPDGRILAGGSFTAFNLAAHSRLVSLTSAGAAEAAFAPNGPDNDINALALQADGKLIVGGSFNFIGGVQRPGVARLDLNGAIDNTFNTGSGVSGGAVFAVALRSDGRVAIGGAFGSVNATAKSRIALLQSNGALDNSLITSCSGEVRAIAFLPDNRLVIGGGFTTVNGVTRPVVARLLSTGELDPTFNAPASISGIAYAVAVQPDGKIVVGGTFDHVGALNVGRMIRLYPDGSLDTTFKTGVGAGFNIRSISLQSDNKIIIGGEFNGYDNLTRNRVARVNPGGSLDATFNIGTGANNTVMASLIQPDGKILIGGFFATFNAVAANNLARINGQAATPAPVITCQPTNQVVFAGEDAAFYVAVSSATAVSYQWRTNGVDVGGATNSSIRIRSAQLADQSAYSVRVVSGGGSDVSATATLTVLPQPRLLEHLAHRYSFSEFAGANQAVDSVGNAHGTLAGAGAGEGFNGSGQLTLLGLGGHVALPAGLISSLTNATLEMWLTWNGPNTQQYQTFFYFSGNSSAFHYTPYSDFPTARLFFSTNITVIARPVLRDVPPPVGVPLHVAVVYHFAANTSKMYLNGQLIAIGSAPSPLSGIKDLNSWLGRAANAPFLNGVYDEFRIYNDALSDAAILASYQAGPNAQQLSIAMTASNLTLSWPLMSTPQSLQTSDNLALGFQTFSYTATTNNSIISVVLPNTGSQRFYRLQ